jgi:hypothetical protein
MAALTTFTLAASRAWDEMSRHVTEAGWHIASAEELRNEYLVQIHRDLAAQAGRRANLSRRIAHTYTRAQIAVERRAQEAVARQWQDVLDRVIEREDNASWEYDRLMESAA